MRKQHKSGFTLVELLVVLAVIAIISSISFGAFRSISDGNKRTSCQSNLSQIYKSVRLYSQDYDGRLPYINENGDPNMGGYSNINETLKGGIGLWSLYTFGKPGFQRPDSLSATASTNCSLSSVDLPAQLEDSSQVANGFVGLSGYVRSAKIFHCPADNFSRDVQYRDLTDTTSPTFDCKTATVDSPTLLIKDGNYNYLNPSYLSYQVTDDSPAAEPTYSSFRRPEATIKYRQITPYKIDTSSNATRIVDRSIKDMTVLTWCRFHRPLDKDGLTRTTSRNFDNVLFSDGSVQSLPVVQNVQNASGSNTGTCSGWQRVPREKAEDMLVTSTPSTILITDCVPSP